MNRSQILRGTILSIAIGLSAASARAGEMVDNPKYQAWSKFKEGSSNTVGADITMGPNTVHVDVVRTLISVSPDNVVVETVSTAKVMGHDHAQPAKRETIPAKTDNQEMKQTGEKDVEAMGKTYKCKVFSATGSDAAPLAKPGAAAPAGNKATVYTNDDVPGGLVKLEATGGNGMQVTFVLTAMKAK